ncbi:hypothetical protein RP20_CCG013021 [Aedes albopictus]|nr:hypothetical protein RP20_CCG013021 [Aedes albopictus]
MAKSVLDLYELYNLVIARGGLVDVINKKLWQEIIKGLHLPSSITSAAFTLRTHRGRRYSTGLIDTPTGDEKNDNFYPGPAVRSDVSIPFNRRTKNH